MRNTRNRRHNMRKGVIVLNSDYGFLNVVNWKQAVKLVVKGKVEVLEFTSRVLENCERTVKIIVPKIIRLVKMIRTLYKARVPYSKRNVFIRDRFQCAYCGDKIGKPTLDHVIPSSKGGKSDFDNTVTACRPCNAVKGDRTPRESGMFMRYQPYQPTVMEFLQIRLRSLGVKDILDEYFESCKI
jgi:5-methylcytosine-specific restriction endonuclease McrA